MAVEAAGNQARLAELMCVSREAISRWGRRGKIPAERVVEVEAATGVPREQLRPDLHRPRA